MGAGDYQPRDVRDVGEEVGAHLLRYLTERLEVEPPGVSRRPGDDDLRPLFARLLPERVVVYEAALLVDAVLDGAIEAGREVDVPAVGQVAAVGQGQPHDLVSRLQEGVVDRLVRGRARVGLDVEIGRA